jgi:protein TIF31
MVEEKAPVAVVSPEKATTETTEMVAAAAAAGEEGAAAAEEEEQAPVLLKDLVILPPRQSKAAGASAAVPQVPIRLPPIQAEEPVQSLRAALTELVGYSAMTNYRLELEPADSSTSNTVVVKSAGTDGAGAATPVISPYTGPNAVVAVPVQVKSLETDPSAPASSTADDAQDAAPTVLDEYGDLTSLEGLLLDGSAFRIVLERYDAATVKDHVARLRSLLDGNAPSVYSLFDEPSSVAAEPAGADASPETASKEESTVAVADAAAKKEEQEQAAPTKKPLAALPSLGAGSVKVDGSKLKDFFYLACGEDPALYHGAAATKSATNGGADSTDHKQSKKKKGKKGKEEDKSAEDGSDGQVRPEQLVREKMPRLNELEEALHVPCSIRYSGFHPPPASRRCLGDIAYLEVTTTPAASDNSTAPTTIFVTAVATGFYVNKSSYARGRVVFDPTPAAKPCFSHTLLDCLLQASPTFKSEWENALAGAKERAEILSVMNQGAFISLFRVAIRGDFGGFQSPATAALAQQQLDATLSTPSWLSPLPRQFQDTDSAWNHNAFHSYNTARVDDELGNTYGVDVRNGGVRDWNEELQLAREMSTDNLLQRVERARLIHKVMTEFGEASLVGVKAISEGQISSMNPNEPTRSQVYLHNNIFFSRAVDAGPETFKIAKGDKAARKSANRDVQCIGTFHRMEKSGLFTLATVLIDYLGTRFVCQSILPGILIGEKSHTLLYGSVEAGVPLKWNEDFHKLLSDKIGDGMMVASRPVLRNPLTEARLEEINLLKKSTPFLSEIERPQEEKEEVGPNDVIESCVPLEAKGILGSDQRKYVLDFGRLTPRDANWVPEEKGGTGKWEAARKQSKTTGAIPVSLDDDEWMMNVLRPELVTRYTQHSMGMYLQGRKEKKLEAEKAKKEGEEAAIKDDEDKKESSEDKPALKEGEKKEGDLAKEDETKEDEKSKLTDEELAHLKSLRLNINVFLPDTRSFEGINEEALDQMKTDELRASDAGIFLWDDVLPKMTKAVKDGNVYQVPVDGKSLTEFIHRNGVNCRYMGQLATLAKEQEKKDAEIAADLERGRLSLVERRTMPKCWLELLECEMVARAGKHVLDSYLTEHGGVAATQPAQTIASFLSALVSETEETAAQTETRVGKRAASQPDEDDYSALTICDTGGDGDAVPAPIRSRYEIWQDIELEVGRRFRYSLSLYNASGKSTRALYIPLLRRLCQRTGVRLVAKDYDIGAKCLCSGGGSFGGRLTVSYPISPLDIVDVVPLMKHSAAYGEGFVTCSLSPSVGLPPLQVSLPDARLALERAHIETSRRALGRGLELAQEAASLYQRVTDNGAHPGVLESMELMANIFLEAGDPVLAAANASKQLGLAVQSGGFDSATVFSAHMSLFQMLYTARQLDESVKHLRAAIYLLEIMSGPRHIEHFSAYHKLGTVYSHGDYEGKYLATSLKLFQEASERDSCDRLMGGFTLRNLAKCQAGLGQYKDAVELEKRAYRTLSLFAGKDHEITKASDDDLKKYTALAVEKGNLTLESDKMRDEEAVALAFAEELATEEEKKKKKPKKKNKNKK